MSNSSFGGPKNPPWFRGGGPATTKQGLQNLQSQILGGLAAQPGLVQYQQPQVFAQNIGLQQQNLGMGLSQIQAQTLSGQLAQNQIYSQMGTVAYPTPRSVSNAPFQNQSSNQSAQSSASQSPKQRVFTGTVTKLHNDFGFVDEDVFFQTNACVKGSNPAVGDRVLVEASYNANMPFKWNAARIQVLPMSNTTGGTRRESQSSSQGKNFMPSPSNYTAVPPPAEGQNGTFNPPGTARNARKSAPSATRRDKDRRDKPVEPRTREVDVEEVERRKRREERERDRQVRDKDREEKDKSSPSRRRSRSPKSRRRLRPVPRYMVQIPKIALDLPGADVLEIRRRYNNLYIPSDFFSTQLRWVDAFPPNAPFTLKQPCSFHVMHKDVDPVYPCDTVLDPPDADYVFSAKVMLLSMPNMDDIYRKCCSMASNKVRDRDSEERDFVHPTRLINFLVGLRGKNETMAVGGPWSPSLDGSNPEKDPSVLIRTAIRTCKGLTGIDLANCTQWYRFVELYYRRGESTHKGRAVPARVETVVIFLPDVWSSAPTRLEWDSMHQLYNKQLEIVLKADQDSSDEAANLVDKDDLQLNSDEPKKEPTHFSELDPKTMKVIDLRQELDARSLNSKGLKSQLIARLVKAIKNEADKVDQEEEDLEVGELASESELEKDKTMPEVKEKEEDRKKREDEEVRKSDEKERAQLEKRYSLPETPHIIVHPSRVAKSGKFDCTVMSLSLLLDYRPEDTKEHSFEVSLFAELFNEMLMRDFGFNIYKALHDLPEKLKEDEPKKDKDEKKKDDEKIKSDAKLDDKDSTRKDDSRKDETKKDDHKKEEHKKEDHKKEEHKRDEHKKEDRKSDSKKEEKEDKRDKKDDYEDDDEDDDKRSSTDKSKSKKKDKPKLVTKDPHLLLSFVYFDQSHCGYIFEKDIEELLYTLGLNLSRAQVRKLVSKVVTRDSLHYRKLTDKPKDEEIKAIQEAVDQSLSNPDNSLKELASGNKRLLPIFHSSNMPPAKRARTECDLDEGPFIPEGFVMYKGGLLDVEKLMYQLKRSEKAREETEQCLVELKHKNTDLEVVNLRSSSNIKELSEKLVEHRKKLNTCEDSLKHETTRTEKFKKVFGDLSIVLDRAKELVIGNKNIKIEEPDTKVDHSREDETKP